MICFGAPSIPYNDTRGRARLPSVHCLSCLTRRPVARCCMGPRRRVSATRAPRLSGGWLRVTTQTGRNVRRSLVARSMLGLATSRPKLQFCGPPPLSLTLNHKPLSAQFTVGSFWGEGTIVVLQTVQDVIDVLGGAAAVGRLAGLKAQLITDHRARHNRLPSSTYLVLTKKLGDLGYTAPAKLWGVVEVPTLSRRRAASDRTRKGRRGDSV
jgi:hypothetical protein